MTTNRLLRWPEVEAAAGIKRSNAYQLIKKGEFPKPVELGERARGWIESEIDEWVQERIDASRGMRSCTTKSE